MDVRNLTYNDYDNLVNWWKFWRFPVPAREMLPNNALDGYMVTNDDKDIVAGFIYKTSSPYLFWIEFIVANPNIKDRELREKSIVYLLEFMTNIIKQMGGKAVYSSINHQNLIKHYEKSGFKQGSKAVEMIKVL